MVDTKTKNLLIVLLVLIVVAILFLLIAHFSTTKSSQDSSIQDISDTSQMANPASVYCEDNNGTLEIRTGEAGQYGVCIRNGKECDEWAFFREECSLD
jgi:hypothetical protein